MYVNGDFSSYMYISFTNLLSLLKNRHIYSEVLNYLKDIFEITSVIFTMCNVFVQCPHPQFSTTVSSLYQVHVLIIRIIIFLTSWQFNKKERLFSSSGMGFSHNISATMDTINKTKAST